MRGLGCFTALSMTTRGLRLRCLRGGTRSKRAPVILSALPVILSEAKNPVHRRETMRGLGCFAVLACPAYRRLAQNDNLGTRHTNQVRKRCLVSA